MVCSVDQLAGQAGISLMRKGGNAVDAAVCASAVLAVTSQYMCGMGGDLFALVHAASGPPRALNASGRSGSGADAEKLRADGHSEMPFTRNIASVPVPGCVDGWLTLLDEYGRLDPSQVFEDAIALARDGFVVTPQLIAAVGRLKNVAHSDDYTGRGPLNPGDVVRRPGIARALEAIATDGREAFYLGEFGHGLIELGAGEYSESDLVENNADWVTPLQVDAFGHRLWTIPPNSAGYLTLAGAAIASGLDLPSDSDDPRWAHILIESAFAAGQGKMDALFEGADGQALLDGQRLAKLRDRIDPNCASNQRGTLAKGGTVYLCAVDSNGMGVSLIQSNAAGWGSQIVEPNTRIFLQNRGIGFSLEKGHPAEYGPRRRPPHTLAPTLVTTLDNELRTVIGTMGGDSQPQVQLQLLARLLNGEDPGDVIAAARWVLAPTTSTGFNAWADPDDLHVALEEHAPQRWRPGLEAMGHEVRPLPAFTSGVGHAHLIDLLGGTLAGAADPRAHNSATAAY